MTATSRTVRFAPRFDTWRRHARRLLADDVAPAALRWLPLEPDSQIPLPAGETVGGAAPGAPGRGPAAVPRRFLELARQAACYRDPERWALLYRVLWRLTHGEPHLLSVPVDPESARLAAMAKAVRRDGHKMKAFVRFRITADPERGAEPLYLAWHRPDHLVVEAVAPFFAERFNDQRWAILTPDRSAHWDRSSLRFGPGAPLSAAPARDELEELWRAYYRSIFNPARLKVKAMKAELPTRHWPTLPEAALIPRLIQEAGARTAEMLAEPRFPPARSFFPDEPTLAGLGRAIHDCRACPLHAPATGAVFGEGPAEAPLMLVGEQPGDQEDRRGRPFVGPAGRLLRTAMAAAGIRPEAAYLTNAVKHFKFVERGTRRIHEGPSRTEVTSCAAWLEEEIRLVAPRLVVCLGGTAARAVIGPGVRVTAQRGKVLESRLAAPAMPTVHPAAVLRIADPPSRRAAYRRLTADLAAAARWVAAAR